MLTIKHDSIAIIVNTATDATLVSAEPPSTGKQPVKTAVLGTWRATADAVFIDNDSIASALRDIHQPLYILRKDKSTVLARGGQAVLGTIDEDADSYPLIGYLPSTGIHQLGDPGFCRDYHVNYPYMTGSMANGIASTTLVKAISHAGMLASFGAAGLSINEIETAINELKLALPDSPYAFNLIHTPNEKDHEDAVVDLYLQHGIDLVEASAYLKLTPAVVRYRVTGIHRNHDGKIVVPNSIIAKASRIEIARLWFSPPPQKILSELQTQGAITADEAMLAESIPMAQDLTVEADSGGHTDNRPAITLIPTIIALRDRLQTQYNYPVPLRVGAAGGIATPASAAAAFSMGAAYIVTGTINQACKESGSSDIARQMLAEAEQADIAMAPAVDMFEMGIKLQVLKRGTMFAMRGNKLYEAYRKYSCIEEIPDSEREVMEKTIFKTSLKNIWEETRAFFLERNPNEVQRAEQDPRYKMALIFRWYLGLSSRWANRGKLDRKVDFQIWCGPAMGAFNEWVKGSDLELPENREVVNVALNLIYGALLTSRFNQLRSQGIKLSPELITFTPLNTETLERLLN